MSFYILAHLTGVSFLEQDSQKQMSFYILAHLDKIEDYAKSQVTSDNKSINALHYKDILQRVKKIRDEYNKADK